MLLGSLLAPSLLLFFLIPESPSFLAARGRRAEMEAALDCLGRGEEKSHPKFALLAKPEPRRTQVEEDSLRCLYDLSQNNWFPDYSTTNCWFTVFSIGPENFNFFLILVLEGLSYQFEFFYKRYG